MKFFLCFYLGLFEVKKVKVLFYYIWNKFLWICRIGKYLYLLLGNVEIISFMWLGRIVGNYVSCLVLFLGLNWLRELRKINSGFFVLV